MARLSAIILPAAFMLTFLAAESSAMMIDGKQMSMDEAIVMAGDNHKMYELMQDDGTVMVELDMQYTVEAYNEMMENMENEQNGTSSGRQKRKAVRGDSYRWRNAEVPYDIVNSQMTSNDLAVIRAAINDYHTYTCIRFRQANGNDVDRVRFQNGAGCSSYVGRIGGVQGISLAQGCRYKGIVIHEMGHAIGFNHEQTRPNRDSYVQILTQNIQRGLEYNFNRYSTNQQNDFGVPYDYRSVMHYSQYAFSSNGQITIRALDSRYQNTMGNRAGFSFNDIALANKMYSCAAKGNCAAIQCPAGGYQAQDCKCYCDSGNDNSPIRECAGTGGGTTTPRPTTCENQNENCDYWANRGFCTGDYEAYMTTNCPLACQTCSDVTTTTTTTTPAAPTTTGSPTVSCTDGSQYCDYWSNRGECSRYPAFMRQHCAKACGLCSTTETVCRDENDYCPNWTEYCTNSIYTAYMRMSCRRTCGLCTASDEQLTTTTTTVAPTEGKPCEDKSSSSYCASNEIKCMWSPNVMRRCAKTCQRC